MVVWGLTLLHPDRVNKVINLSLPYQERGEIPWIKMMEQFLGDDYYFVHFNKFPGVADAVLDNNAAQFLCNLYRKNVPLTQPEPGMLMIKLAEASSPKGEPVMSEAELDVFISSFKNNGFTSSINWYRNLDRNWHLLANVDPIIHQPTLMIYGDQDVIPKFERLNDYVPNAESTSLNCGHWIQQEKPEELNQVLVNWLTEQNVD